MCDEVICSDSGVVSLCEDDRKLLASLGARKPLQIREDKDEKEDKSRSDNNNVSSETNRNLPSTKTDDQGIEGCED